MLLSREELSRLSVMDPTIAEAIKKNPVPDFDLANIDWKTMRAGMKKMEDAYNAGAIPAADESYHQISMRDGFSSTIKIHKPVDAAPGPLIALFFGGGFVCGSLEQFTRTARALNKVLGATVVSCSYRLAPEYQFPTGQLDAWDSMKWIAANATGPLLHSDPSKGFIIGGISAGAAAAAALSRQFQDHPLAHPLTAQWLAIPSTMDSSCVPKGYEDYFISSDEQADGPFLSKKSRAVMQKASGRDPKAPLAYAINGTAPFSGQPKTYFQVDGMDPLRDDALIYDDLLTKAGVTTKVDIYPGCPHGHFNGFAGLEITDRANIDSIVGIGWLVGKEVPRDIAAEALGLAKR